MNTAPSGQLSDSAWLATQIMNTIMRAKIIQFPAESLQINTSLYISAAGQVCTENPVTH